MQAVIMCAGKSTRTYPLTVTKPKPLLKIANKTIIEYNLEQLDGLVDEAIIIINYRGEMIKKAAGKNFRKIKVTYAYQKTANGTGGAIFSVKKLLKEKFIVMNGDDLFSKEDIKKCIRHDYCVLVKDVDDLRNFGEVKTDNRYVTGMHEKPKQKKKGKANTGLYVFSKNIFRYKLKKSARDEYEIIDYLSFLIKDKVKINFERASFWMPITYPWSLLEANEALLKVIKAKNSGEIEKGATIKGNIVIGKGSVIRPGCYIDGPVIIGENCTIGPNCYIRPFTAIGNNSKVGNAVEIKNSIIGNSTSIGHLSYVGDSVIGDNVNFGAGTITANLRHDDNTIMSSVKGELVDSGRRKLGTIIGDNVHTGINTSIYPGRKIWPGKTTLPGEIIKKDIV